MIGYTNLVPHFQNAFGAPYYVVHRAHLHESMQRLARDLGVKILTASKVTDIDMDVPSLTLQDGSTFAGDLIVAADGKWTMSGEQKRQKSDREVSKGLILLPAKRYWMAWIRVLSQQALRLIGQL